jgi:hypothetical protein
MNLLEFKENIVTPLRKTVEQYKSATLAQFNSRDDLTRQWDRAEGMTMALMHTENVYNVATNPQGEEQIQQTEILPPQ